MQVVVDTRSEDGYALYQYYLSLSLSLGLDNFAGLILVILIQLHYYRTWYRYFVTHTKWYFMSYTAWLPL